MTISSETRKAGPYSCNGATTDFVFSFKVFAATEVLVVANDSGAESTLVKDTNYSVALNADQDNNPGGTITTIGAGSPYTAPRTLTLTSAVTETQGTALPSGGGWFPKVIENALDKLTILCQQILLVGARGLRQPISDASLIAELPGKTSRASKVLAFDANGDPVAQDVVPTSGVLATAFMETLLDDTTAQQARQTLQLDKHGADIASAATLDLSGAAIGDLIDVTGNTGITAITLPEGVEKTLRLAGTPLITNGASLVCPGGVNIQGAAGDTFKVRGYAGGVVRIFGYQAFEQGVLSKIVTTKGDMLVATAARTVARKGVGANGTVPMARSADASGLAYVAALNKAIYGLTYANNGGDSIDIAAGGAMDATGAYWMTLGSLLTKNVTTAWAVGSAAGGLDTGAVGNSDYYIWLIARSDTGVVDALFSLSSTAPTMPANYDFKRLIGWFKRVGGVNVAFTTYETAGGGLELLWTAPTLDIDLTNTLTTTRRTDAVKVPLNFSVIANLNLWVSDDNAGLIAYVYCPDASDQAASISAAPLVSHRQEAATSGVGWADKIRTSATGTIAAISNTATVNSYRVSTLGFEWGRRN